jgi:hypothetical protein
MVNASTRPSLVKFRPSRGISPGRRQGGSSSAHAEKASGSARLVARMRVESSPLGEHLAHNAAVPPAPRVGRVTAISWGPAARRAP